MVTFSLGRIARNKSRPTQFLGTHFNNRMKLDVAVVVDTKRAMKVLFQFLFQICDAALQCGLG